MVVAGGSISGLLTAREIGKKGYSVLDILDDCEYSYTGIQITEPSPIELYDDLNNDGVINSDINDIVYTEYVCLGDCDGQINLSTISGGTPPYNFERLI